jgi:hypothetical protein
MTLIIQKPTGAKLVLAKDFSFDADAAAYIAAVEAADTQALETATRYAINDFVIGCKQDGIWSAIKASCILAGARTLTGALVPLVGPAPTNNNFVAGDYNRKTGLVGNGSTKYLDSNRNNNADLQNSKHVSAHITTAQTIASVFLGTATSLNVAGDLYMFSAGSSPPTNVTARLHSNAIGLSLLLSVPLTGLAGITRSSSSDFFGRFNKVNYTSGLNTSQAPLNELIHVFKGGNQYSNARLAFYSIGESLDLALLDARVTDLINAFAAAIP